MGLTKYNLYGLKFPLSKLGKVDNILRYVYFSEYVDNIMENAS